MFAYAKSGTRGAAKYGNEDYLWEYLTDNKGKLVPKYESKRIRLKVGGEHVESDLEEKAVRQLIRTVIEKWGNGDSDMTKTNRRTNTPKHTQT